MQVSCVHEQEGISLACMLRTSRMLTGKKATDLLTAYLSSY